MSIRAHSPGESARVWDGSGISIRALDWRPPVRPSPPGLESGVHRLQLTSREGLPLSKSVDGNCTASDAAFMLLQSAH